jgi:hypothetical protein
VLAVWDANGHSLAHIYSRENPNDAHMAKVLTQSRGRICGKAHRIKGQSRAPCKASTPSTCYF